MTLDIARRAPDFRNNDVGVRFTADIVDKFLDFVRNMRDDLHGLAAAFLIQDVPVDLARREVGKLVKVLVDKAFVVPEIEIGLRAVVRDEHLAVLIRAHCARVHIDVRVELPHRDLSAVRLQKTSKRHRRDTFPRAGDDAPVTKINFRILLQPQFS